MPLGFVMSVTLIREAIDDIRRWQRDREVNNSRWYNLLPYPGYPVVHSFLGYSYKPVMRTQIRIQDLKKKFYGSESGSSPNFDTDPGKNDTIPDPDLKDSVPGSLRKILKI